MRLYIHGNCQAWAIDRMLRELDIDWEIEHRQVQLFDLNSSEECQAYKDLVETADIILAQPISRDYRDSDLLSLDFIRQNAKRCRKLLTFPAIYFRAPMIQSYIIAVDGHPTDYHDMHIADMFRHGIPADECAARIQSADFFPAGFVEREAMIALTSLMKHEVDSAIDIAISDVIGARMSDRPLFHTFDHPMRLPLAMIVNRMFHLIGLAERIPIEGRCYLNDVRVQPYRSAAFQLGIPAASLPELGTNTILQETSPIADHVAAVYHSYARHGRTAISDAIRRNGEAAAYLERFEEMGRCHDRCLSEPDLIDQACLAILDRPATIDELRSWTARRAGRNVQAMLREMIDAGDHGRVDTRHRA